MLPVATYCVVPDGAISVRARFTETPPRILFVEQRRAEGDDTEEAGVSTLESPKPPPDPVFHHIRPGPESGMVRRSPRAAP